MFNQLSNLSNAEDIFEVIATLGTAGYSMFTWLSNIIKIALAILSVIGLWKMYYKAGENEWGAIIPFYNKYLLFKISDMKNWYWPYLALSIIYFIDLIALFIFLFAAFAAGISGHSDYEMIKEACGVAVLIFIVVAILIFILTIARNIKLVQNFHLNGLWVVGLILLPGVFYMIIGCSGKIHFKDRLPSGLLPGQIPSGAGQNRDGYAQPAYDPYGSQKTYGQSSVYSAQNPYAQSNPYGPQNSAYGSQNASYGQNVYGTQNNPYGSQNSPYGQNAYGQNGTQYYQNAYGQNNTGTAQSAYGQNQGSVQNPYGQNSADVPQSASPASKGGRDEAVWNTIYDENANNIK